MSRPSQRPQEIDLGDILGRPVTVRLDGEEVVMEPFEAQFEQCANAALKGDIGACGRFIRWCLREGLIAPVEPFDDHQYSLRVPKDWGTDEFLEMYDKHGPPPWLGPRDGLTSAERERRRELGKRRARR